MAAFLAPATAKITSGTAVIGILTKGLLRSCFGVVIIPARRAVRRGGGTMGARGICRTADATRRRSARRVIDWRGLLSDSPLGGAPSMGTILQVEKILRMLRADIKHSGGQTAWARKHQADRTVLNKVLHSHFPVTLSIARALNLRRVYIRDWARTAFALVRRRAVRQAQRVARSRVNRSGLCRAFSISRANRCSERRDS